MGPRYGVIADVHGNLHALRATLAGFTAAGIDRVLCLGDVIGYGPHPVECVELVESLDPVAVAGNHEYAALGLLSDEGFTASARRSLAWTRDALTPEVRQSLAKRPLVAEAPGVLLAHGSPDRVDEYVRSEARAVELLDRLPDEHPGATTLLLGHTHEAWAFGGGRGTLLRGRPGRVALEPGGRVLLNPGSVGQSRDRHAHARCLVLDLGAGTADFQSFPYDIEGCRQALRERGLPAEWCHVVPPRRERVRGAARDAVRRAWRR